MARKSRAGTPVPEEPSAGPLPRSPKELVVLAKPELGLRAEGAHIASATGADRDAAKLGELLSRSGATIRPLFGLSEDRLLARTHARAPEAAGTPTDLSLFYHVDAPQPQLEALAEELRKQPGVEGAYIKPEAEPPVAAPEVIRPLNDMTPQAEAPPATPDFIARQVYLNAAPEGVDALYAWTLPGGRGAGVRVIDCEWGWNFTHEDLLQNQSGVLVGVSSTDDNHGTAVLGAPSSTSRRPRRSVKRPTSFPPATSSCSRSTALAPTPPARASSATSPSSGGRTTSRPFATPSTRA